MVTQKQKKRHGTLTKKLFRDMHRSAMQFLAMFLLCAMGTWCFSGLDANWRMLERSTNTPIEQSNLADFWVKGASFSKADLRKLENIKGVSDAQARVTLEMDCPDLGEDVSLMVHGYDGDMRICTPIVRAGTTMDASDLRGCLVEEQFAQAHQLSVGDAIKVSYGGLSVSFEIRGIILSGEYLVTSKSITPDPEHYGYLYVSARALSAFPFTEVLLKLDADADAIQVREDILDACPSSVLVDEETHSGTASARNFVSMFRSLSYLFPLLVFAVAAMIVVSTLTRMIENQRIQMGTLKALGYRDRQIRRHYLSYALVPSVAGSVLGVLTGYVSIPRVVWPIVSTNVRYPEQLYAPISGTAWMIAGVSVAMSLLICLYTYQRAAKETTANLLRPKPPKSGSRILLERLPRLWGRFSFNTKMIVRNILRNKGRTALSLVGILACNMLIICSFGLQESMNTFIADYYTRTLRYDVRADLASGQGATLDGYRKRLDAQKIDGIMEQSVSMYTDGDTRTCLLTVMTNDQTSIAIGEDASLIPLPEKGVYISTKLAKTVHVGVGDTITLRLPGDVDAITVSVVGLADTDIGQGLFMSKQAWEALRKGDFRITSLLLTKPTALTEHLLAEMEEVTTLLYPAKQLVEMASIMDSTTAAFTILSVAALALAFIICYNMGLMNFTERTRDYATLKVLGYHQKEIRGLMLRENHYVSLLGVLLGIPPGFLITTIILKMCEYDNMVFPTHITFWSVAGACIVTYVFALMIQCLLTRKVRSIDMVEALKSVE